MANTFLNLPAPAANAAGAAVDVSTMGKLKSIMVSGHWGGTITPIITIEVNNDAAAAGSWTAIWSTQGGGAFSTSIACKWMRARVANYRGGPAPEIDVGSDDGGTTFAALDVPASGNGAGSSVDVSALPNFKTVQCCGTFQGAVIIEVSEDGTTSWAQVLAFQSGTPGATSVQLAAHFMRARRAGVPTIGPGTPVVNVGACADGGGGGGGGITAATIGTPQGFKYTVLGTEPDLANLVIALPAARALNTYDVVVTPQTLTASIMPSVPGASKAVNQFVLALSAAATAGDTFSFYVFDAFNTV